jgi:transposase
MAKQDKSSTTTSAEIEALLERIKEKNLSESDLLLVERVITLFLKLLVKIEQKRTTVRQLRVILFGKPKNDEIKGSNNDTEQTQATAKQSEPAASAEPKPKRPGHGRKPASAYTGAKVVHCQQAELQAGAPCLDKLCKGHLQQYYRRTTSFIRFEGQPLVGATRYDQEMLRCSDCTTLYTVKLPDGVPAEKFSATADAAITLGKYGSGLPFNRLAQLQSKFGIPISASVLWERVLSVANVLLPIFLHLRLLAAQAEVIYYDDTAVKIIDCQPHKADKRKGIRTTAIIAEMDSHRVALYVSGRNHAGDNISELLETRPAGLGILIRMCDALKLNLAVAEETIISLCLQHGRRKFVELSDLHKEDCQPVIDVIGQVYANEARAKGLRPEERLLYHQLYSGPLMEALKEWIEERFEKKKVEPNSVVGSAYNYLLNHWKGLTQFLSTPNAPIDNNAAERALKIVQLHRKNANYFRNDLGAFVSDVCMSLIESCKLSGIEPFSYLVAIIRNERAVRANPAAWLPWNYAQTMNKQAA